MNIEYPVIVIVRIIDIVPDSKRVRLPLSLSLCSPETVSVSVPGEISLATGHHQQDDGQQEEHQQQPTMVGWYQGKSLLLMLRSDCSELR